MAMQSPPNDLLTVAEQSEYTATATSAQVLELIDRIHQQSTIMHVAEMGRTVEGKSIPLIVLAHPPITFDTTSNPATEISRASTQSGRPICFVMANIHAGEVEGKEACLMLTREIALDHDHALLKDLIIVIAPNYNADGNDKFDDVAKNRPGQIGPTHCGVRHNSEGLDLNRDYIKLEAPESRALVKFLNDCDPHITVDCHTTNGSHHRYTLTFDAPLNPSGHAAPREFVRNELLQEVTKRVKESTGYDMWFYGNFNRAYPPTAWETYSAQPRFGGSYQGLRNQMSVLSEAYSYAPFKDRTIATREFLREILRHVAENKQQVIEIHHRARQETMAKGLNPQPSDVVGIRHRIAAFNKPVTVMGYEKAQGGAGGAVANQQSELGQPKDYEVIHLGRFEPTLAVARPHAYLIPANAALNPIIEKLQQHGIAVEKFQGSVLAEVYTITSISRAERKFQGHHEMTVEVQSRLERITLAEGSYVVTTAQPLGTLAVYLLEPQSEDGLVTWNFFDDHLTIDKDFPVMRVRAARDMNE